MTTDPFTHRRGDSLHLIKLVGDRKIEPGRVFDLVLPLEQVAEGYRAMDERRATKILLLPNGKR